ARRLAFTPWSRWKSDRAVMNVVHRPPFTLQYDFQQRFPERRRRFKEESNAALSPEELKQTLEAYDLALKERPGDSLLRANLVELLSERGDFGRAIIEARTLVAQQSGYGRSKLRLGDALMRAGELDE